MLYRITTRDLTQRAGWVKMIEDMQHEGILVAVKDDASIRRGVRLKLDYNMQCDQVSKSMDCARGKDWTAFVNKKRTLVHVMLYDHPSVLIRVPRLKMKDWSNKAIKTLITTLLYEVL